MKKQDMGASGNWKFNTLEGCEVGLIAVDWMNNAICCPQKLWECFKGKVKTNQGFYEHIETPD